MAQAQPKTPLEILQASINGVLIETGKAFRAAGIDGGKTMAVSAMKLHSTIPYITNNFHRALDDLEAEIIRAKAVLGRDLEEMRSKRIAAESPPVPIIEEPAAPGTLLPPQTKRYEDPQVAFQQDKEATPLPTILSEEENPLNSDQSSETVDKEEMKERGVLSPPSTNDRKVQAIGLGITTTLPASTDAPTTATTGGQVSSIDSLFDISNSATNHDSSALNFDNMDFTMQDASTGTQSQSNNQTQNTEFDLSTFGNNPQDFSMHGLHSSNETSSNNVNIATTNNKGNMMDKLLNMASTAGSGTNSNDNNNNNNSNNNMGVDMDLDNMVEAEESVFDELFFGGDDDGNVGGGVGEMEHGQFDNAFFGID